MPARSKMSDQEVEEIQRLISEGLSDSAIAAEVGRHRTSVVKVRAGSRARNVTTGGKQLQIRLSEEEYDAFKREIDRIGVSMSEGGRRLVRHALGVLDVDDVEVEALAELRRALNVIGGDLNKMARSAKSGAFQCDDADRLFLERIDLKVDDVVNQLIAFVGAGRRKAFVQAVFPVEGPLNE